MLRMFSKSSMISPALNWYVVTVKDSKKYWRQKW